MSDARTEGTTAQNAELVAASWADSLVDAPFWLYNRATGSSVDAPLDLASKVYTAQTADLYKDLTPDEIEAAAKNAEDGGAIILAGEQTAGQIADHPLSIIPTWATVLAIVLVAIVGLFYGIQIYAAVA